MPFKLYEDQEHDVAALRTLFRTNKSVVYSIGTGGGKTIIAGWIAQALRRRDRKILVLLHRRELVGQFYRTLDAARLSGDVGVVCTGWPSTPHAPIQIAMIVTWARRNVPFTPDFIVVDEAHHARARTWETVLGRYPEARVLGLTATPQRLDGKGLGRHFEAMHVGLSIPELIRRGRLAPVRTLFVPAGFNRRRLKKTAGDFNRKQLDERADGKVVGASVSAYQRYIPGRRTIMFAVSKRHARETAERLRDVGVAAAYVGDDTPQRERDAAFERFSDGLIDVICNVALVDEGFDVPACDAIMDVAPTASVTRFLQRVGRCMRYQPGKEAVFLDLVGNVHSHGLPDTARSWSLSDVDVAARKTGASSDSGMRHCRSCMTVYSASRSTCPSCGAVPEGPPITEVDVELIEGDMSARPDPSGPPRPKMTAGGRKRLLRDARILVRQGEPVRAWRLIDDAAKANGYKPGFSHIMAGLAAIDREHRH